MSMIRDAWHWVDGVYWAALDTDFTSSQRWSQDGDRDGHFIGHVDLGEAGHLSWDSATGWTHHAPGGATEKIAESDAHPRDVVMALDVEDA